MTGKACTGQPTNNADLIRESKAFCEGMHYRHGGTQAERPLTDNPHIAGSSNFDSWELGWAVANGSAGATIDPRAAPCCAVPNTVVPV